MSDRLVKNKNVIIYFEFQNYTNWSTQSFFIIWNLTLQIQQVVTIEMKTTIISTCYSLQNILICCETSLSRFLYLFSLSDVEKWREKEELHYAQVDKISYWIVKNKRKNSKLRGDIEFQKNFVRYFFPLENSVWEIVKLNQSLCWKCISYLEHAYFYYYWK